MEQYNYMEAFKILNQSSTLDNLNQIYGEKTVSLLNCLRIFM
jgi:hypothetical protein